MKPVSLKVESEIKEVFTTKDTEAKGENILGVQHRHAHTVIKL
jgi:hypothetical protein